MIDVKNNLRGIAKFAIVFLVTLLAVFILEGKVNATTQYSDEGKNFTITLDKEIGIQGTETKFNFSSSEDGYTDNIGLIKSNIVIVNAKQDELNEYAKSPKTFNANIKTKLPENDFEKVVWVERNIENGGYIEVEKEQIESVNGNKYINYTCELKYNNIENDEAIDDNIREVCIHSGIMANSPSNKRAIKLIKRDGSYVIYELSTNIRILSENQPVNYDYEYVNKYDQSYPVSGGMGSGPDGEDKWYQTEQTDILGYGGFREGHYLIPEETQLNEAYFKLNVDTYQGETLNIEGLGTLYYAGLTERNMYNTVKEKREPKTMYVYKNSLNNLTKISKVLTFNLKGANGYEYTRCINYGWTLSDEVKEETITGQISTENKDLDFNVLIYGNGNAKFKAIDIDKNDTLYLKLENELKDTITDDYNYINIGTFDITVIEGAYNGEITLTFDIGEEYNGKECVIGHLKNGLYYEQFERKVENGKVTVTVDSLSPFMISVLEEKEDITPTAPTEQEQPTNTDDKELDETPKTGEDNNITLPISIIALISLTGIVIVKKYTK